MKSKLVYLYIVYGISVFILLLLSFLFYKRLDNLSASSNLVNHTYLVIQQLNNIETDLNNLETNQRGFLISRDSVFLHAYQNTKKMLPHALQSIQSLTKDNSVQQKNFSTLDAWFNLRMKYLDENVNVPLINNEVIERIKLGKIVMDTCSNVIARMKLEEHNLLDKRNTNQQFYERTTPQSFKMIFFFSFAVFIISCLLIAREFRRRAKFQHELERKVYEQKRLAAELQEFSFISSHNIQEPLRKIQTFSNRLITKHAPSLNDEGKLIVNRINSAAASMHELINSFVNYTTTVSTNENIIAVNLNTLIEEIKEDVNHCLTEKNASIEMENLELIYGYPKQLYVLFKALINNAIQFSKPGIAPVIKIYGCEIDGNNLPAADSIANRNYYKINVCDNGIGFDNIYSQKIFKLFQRLNAEYGLNNSKGVGLAIVNQVMINHHGFVIAKGETDNGACFSLFFPTEKITRKRFLKKNKFLLPTNFK